jgi:hypothetical protein
MEHEHDLAVQNRAVERYVLGELSGPERDAFEDHFFSCAMCAEDVRATTMFVDNAKAVLSEPPKPLARSQAAPRTVSRSWFGWLQPASVAFAALCLAMVGYQSAVVIPALKLPHAIPATVLHAATRGSVPVFEQGQPLSFEIMPESPAAGELNIEIRSESGAVVRTFKSAAPKPDQALNISIPYPDLKPGRYAIAATGAQYPFEVR